MCIWKISQLHSFTEENLKQKIENPPNTTLTAFFEQCKQDGFAKTLLYNEIPKYYTWNASNKQFQRRKQGSRLDDKSDICYTDTIGRVYTIHPNNAECYFLRMLLHCVRGPSSFVDIKTVDGHLCCTYREACEKMGLLESNQHWELTLAEASLFSSPNNIRSLFAIILTTCTPSDPQGKDKHI